MLNYPEASWDDPKLMEFNYEAAYNLIERVEYIEAESNHTAYQRWSVIVREHSEKAICLGWIEKDWCNDYYAIPMFGVRSQRKMYVYHANQNIFTAPVRKDAALALIRIYLKDSRLTLGPPLTPPDIETEYTIWEPQRG